MKKILLVLLLLAHWPVFSVHCSMAFAQEQYYRKAEGLRGTQLKAALHDLIQPDRVLDYGGGEGKTWSGFWLTDQMEQFGFDLEFEDEPEQDEIKDELPENPEGPILEKIHELSEVIAKCNAAHTRNSERAILRMNILGYRAYYILYWLFFQGLFVPDRTKATGRRCLPVAQEPIRFYASSFRVYLIRRTVRNIATTPIGAAIRQSGTNPARI